MTTASELPRAEGIVFAREIGRGAQAQVFEAEAPGSGGERNKVAVKVLLTREPEDEADFMRECGLVRRVRDTAVVPNYGVVRTEDGRLACIMELVEGKTLADLLRQGEVPRERALAIVASAARALAAVHQAGIIHRDVKPANMLVEPTGRVRILDFGMARETNEKIPPGTIEGTPSYLAPEQTSGLGTSPATDLWALGVVLYQLLTGTVPFTGANLTALLLAIVETAPIPPRTKNPALGAWDEAIILRCLEKDPARRPPTAEALADTLECLLEGPVEAALVPFVLETASRAPADDEASPPLPEKERASQQYRWSWEFDASPAKLWDTVSNTEKFNRAAGLPPVEFNDVPDGKGGVERIGSFSWMGLEIEWVEHPFEWVAPERLSVLRVYRKGPLAAMWSEMTLTPRAGGGTTLVHELRMAPRGPLGRIAALLEVQLRAGKKIEAVYRKLADTARLKRPLVMDMEKTPLAATGEERLLRGMKRVETSGLPHAALAPLLTACVREADDPDVTRLRPYELAARWNVPRRTAVALLVHACSEGVLELGWDLLCPTCRVPMRAYPTLATLNAQAHCEACQASFDTDFARSVEVVFRPRPEVRPVPPLTYCLGGPGFFPHVALQQELEPGETRSLTVKLDPGPWRLAVRGLRSTYDFEVGPEGETAASVLLERVTVKPGPRRLAAGILGFTFTNGSKKRRVVRIESALWRADALTALEACGIPELRRLGAAAPPGEPIRIASTCWLAARGVEPARFQERVEEAYGSVSGGTGDALAAIALPRAAFGVALAIARDGGIAALHVAPGLACALGEATAPQAGLRTGFDGPGPRIATELLDGCQKGEVAATHLVLGSPGVADLVGTRPSRAQEKRVNEEGLLGVIYLSGEIPRSPHEGLRPSDSPASGAG
jgi:serine/threonine protein kinase